MGTLLFVYGTLKQGFFNHRFNRGERVPGEFVTLQRFPLYLVGPRFLPWLVYAPGQGEHVIGQVYRVASDALASMDDLARVHEPGWYSRVPVGVRSLDADEPVALNCQLYAGGFERPVQFGIRLGPLNEYSLEHAELMVIQDDARFIRHAACTRV